MERIISSDHAGFRAARQAVFGGTPWQRCQTHLQQSAHTYVPRQAMQAEAANRIRETFHAPSQETAEQFLKAFVERNWQSGRRSLCRKG